jgi:nitrate reductase NapAB chaperone NapD
MSMARPEFDFHARPARASKFGIVLALAAAVALGLGWSRLQAARANGAGIVLQIATLEQDKPRPAARPTTHRDDTQARIASQLAYSWQPAFDALAAARSKKIALVSLDAVQAKSQLNLVAEARRLGDAVDFIDALRQQPGVKRAVLIQHEVMLDDAQQPVRFNILVELGA